MRVWRNAGANEIRVPAVSIAASISFSAAGPASSRLNTCFFCVAVDTPTVAQAPSRSCGSSSLSSSARKRRATTRLARAPESALRTLPVEVLSAPPWRALPVSTRLALPSGRSKRTEVAAPPTPLRSSVIASIDAAVIGGVACAPAMDVASAHDIHHRTAHTPTRCFATTSTGCVMTCIWRRRGSVPRDSADGHG